MPLPSLARVSVVTLALAALAACASEPQSAVNSSATARPAELKTIDVPEEKRRELSRDLQLQTPISLPPEDTGGPQPHYYPNGSEIGRDELVAGGVNVEPQLRVWQRWPAGTRQIYGPQPSAVDPILQPVVVAPQ